jgi:hypothetical protein
LATRRAWRLIWPAGPPSRKSKKAIIVSAAVWTAGAHG